MKPKKLKGTEPSAKDKLSADFTKRLEAKWREQGDNVLDAAFKESPTKIAEMIARLVSSTEPRSEGFEGCKTPRDLGIALLKSVHINEYEMTEDMIAQALKCNDDFIDRLQAIRAAAEGAMQ